DQKILFSAIGQIGEMLYEVGIDELTDVNLSEKTTGAYSITFLKTILKIASITEKLEVSLKTDHPLKMEFTILEGGDLEYYLAPRTEEEEQYEDDWEDDKEFTSDEDTKETEPEDIEDTEESDIEEDEI
ncbi:MAG: hypothetical protein EU535_08435, partial [Promethearchaeota archaeon]